MSRVSDTQPNGLHEILRLMSPQEKTLSAKQRRRQANKEKAQAKRAVQVAQETAEAAAAEAAEAAAAEAAEALATAAAQEAECLEQDLAESVRALADTRKGLSLRAGSVRSHKPIHPPLPESPGTGKISMCNSVQRRFRCKFRTCRYAHCTEELEPVRCKHGRRCNRVCLKGPRAVVAVGDQLMVVETWGNVPSKEGWLCCGYHPHETAKNVKERLEG